MKKDLQAWGCTPEETDIAMPYSAERCLHAGTGPRNIREGDSPKNSLATVLDGMRRGSFSVTVSGVVDLLRKC
ncbi:uncharacterized protein LAJ45_08965 [Morchella importuna]|uniref:uncharacterized protein n=1 Tax=Morchella importuna TaxID=1174673 RepID=UPI001E8DB66C|nr:uncharacterized protein LAJ45_08965 [Morchella importuna]KAH8146886.1 hypothetical protein LAJ45_08965 [Morchella importuna]